MIGQKLPLGVHFHNFLDNCYKCRRLGHFARALQRSAQGKHLMYSLELVKRVGCKVHTHRKRMWSKRRFNLYLNKRVKRVQTSLIVDMHLELRKGKRGRRNKIGSWSHPKRFQLKMDTLGTLYMKKLNIVVRRTTQ